MCLESLIRQDVSAEDFEVLVADDCSTDGTSELASSYVAKLPHLRVITRNLNEGPGAARNAGLECARGQWVLFLDSDDELSPTALSLLTHFMELSSGRYLSAIGFDWSSLGSRDALNSSKRIGRRDGQFLESRERLLHQYLSHRMDGSVIYTTVRKDLLEKFKIRFAPGLHEDVDFIFKVYFHSPETSYLDQALYLKRNHEASIINTISARHVEGYFRAWDAIKNFLQSVEQDARLLAKYMESYKIGTVGVIATRVREVVRHCVNPEEIQNLFSIIHSHTKRLIQKGDFDEKNESKTVYSAIASRFWHVMNSLSMDAKEKALTVTSEVRQMSGKSWSCTDLHHSLFLRPDQVRTCCKRFFVGGEMRGDVVLFDVKQKRDAPISKEAVLEAKRDLHQKINSGEPSPCDGCPFLEFRAWTPLNELDIKYLSMEHHSLCNMRCTYCSDDYFGGKGTSYNVRRTLEDFLKSGVLKNCELVVWGGGEPVLGRDFTNMIHMLTTNLPAAQQRVLTNAVERSSTLETLLVQQKAQIITSIDAGTEATFETVRGRSDLRKVCENLMIYARANSARVTIKYIFTDGNESVEEVKCFVALMREYDLMQCNFQISCDFKHEFINPDVASAMILMFGLLCKIGNSAVIFDELLRHRLSAVINFDDSTQIERIHALAGFNFIATPFKYSHVIIWGAGQLAKYLLEKSVFFKNVEVDFFVDSTPEKVGSYFFGKEVRDPSALLNNDLPVVIAAVQGYPLILEKFHQMGLSGSRLIQELIL